MGDERGTSEPILGRGSHTDVSSFMDLRSGRPTDPLEKEVSPVNQRNIERQEPSYLLTMPGEILNTIARLLLVPGRVTAFTSHHHNPYATEDRPPNRFSVLATCKQLHRSFASIYYGENVFSLPPGSIPETELYFSKLLPSHQLLIRYVSIPFTTVDGLPLQGYEAPEQPVRFEQATICAADCRQGWRLRFRLICAFHEQQLATGGWGLDNLSLEWSEAPKLRPIVLGRGVIPKGLTDQVLLELPFGFELLFNAAELHLTVQAELHLTIQVLQRFLDAVLS